MDNNDEGDGNDDEERAGRDEDINGENGRENDVNEDDFYEENENDPGATKKRSKVWEHFTVIHNAAGTKFAKCKHCPNK